MGFEQWKHAGYILPLVLAFAAIVLIPVGAFASEGHEAPRWGDFGWRVLNFVIFAGILWYFCWWAWPSDSSRISR